MGQNKDGHMDDFTPQPYQ